MDKPDALWLGDNVLLTQEILDAWSNYLGIDTGMGCDLINRKAVKVLGSNIWRCKFNDYWLYPSRSTTSNHYNVIDLETVLNTPLSTPSVFYRKVNLP